MRDWSAVHLSVLHGSDSVFFLKQCVEVCAVCKL